MAKHDGSSGHAIETRAAPAAVGPYSQAVRAGSLVFCSGQIPLDPASGEVVTGDVTAQTRRTLENLRAVLAAAGLSMSDVVRTTVFLVDLAEFSRMNEVYATYFRPPYPARATVEVSALPKGVRVEIDAIAYDPGR